MKITLGRPIELIHLVPQAFENDLLSIVITVSDKNYKFVTAPTGRDVCLTETVLDDLRGAADGFAAGLVAVVVVDQF